MGLGKFRDSIGVRVAVKFTWPDRLRILLHGEASVRVEVDTEHRPGKIRAASEVTVRPLIQRRILAPVADAQKALAP